MKTNQGFVLRNVMGQHIIVAEGNRHANFHKMISLNPSAALMWREVEGKEFSVQDLADILTAHYDVDAARALSDAKEIAEKWIENGLVEA